MHGNSSSLHTDSGKRENKNKNKVEINFEVLYYTYIYCFSRHGSNYEPLVISKPCYMAQGACIAGHAWFWDYRGLIVWSHALNKAVNMCFIYQNNSNRMDLKKILHEKPGWIVLRGATNVQCHCCVTINSTARCANRVENAHSDARSRNRLNHCTKENFTRKPMAFPVKKYSNNPREKVL